MVILEGKGLPSGADLTQKIKTTSRRAQAKPNLPRMDKSVLCVYVFACVRLRKKDEKLKGSGSRQQRVRAGWWWLWPSDRINDWRSWQGRRAGKPGLWPGGLQALYLVGWGGCAASRMAGCHVPDTEKLRLEGGVPGRWKA